jgi:hypothetical protein
MIQALLPSVCTAHHLGGQQPHSDHRVVQSPDSRQPQPWLGTSDWHARRHTRFSTVGTHTSLDTPRVGFWLCLGPYALCNCYQPQAQTGSLPPKHCCDCIHHLSDRLSGQHWGWPKVGWSDPQHHTPPFLSRLQGLLTLFAKSFASFDHSTCALSVPW